MGILCIAILSAGSKAGLPDMENTGGHIVCSFGQHLVDADEPRHLGMRELEDRVGATSIQFSQCNPISCLGTGNLQNF
jgi:hypothetical protein